MWKIVLKSGLIMLCLYIVALVTIYFKQRQFMYFPPGPPTSNALPDGISEINQTTSLDDNVIAWWHPPESDEGVIIYFHGNGSAVYQAGFLYQEFMEAGFGFLAVEYPGYPGSSGTPTEEALIATAESFYDFLIAEGVQPENISLYGTSLGAAVAVQLAARKPVGKIVVEAPFHSMLDMVKQRMPMFGFRTLVKDQYESFKALKGLDIPLLWLHGTHDRVIPIREGQKLYDSYDGPKEKLIIDGGSHVDLWNLGGRERITSFLKAPVDRP